VDIQLLALILAFTLPISVRALRSFFTFDDLMNLHYYLQRPWQALLSNFAVFTSFRRPLGSLLYLPLYALAGMDPRPYYLVGILLYSVNVALVFQLVRRLTRSRVTTIVATALFALHPMIHNVLFNFGAVFELLCLMFLLISLLVYARWSESPDRGRGLYLVSLGCFVAALNAKETAVVLPAILLAYEGIYGRFRAAPHGNVTAILKRVAPFFALAVPYTLAKTLGEEAYWRDNPLYVYHFDFTMLLNLSEYLTLATNREVPLSPLAAPISLALVVAGGLILRSRAMLFGCAWASLTLIPVLPLPRVWELFLYVPLPGLALAVAAGLFEAGRRVASRVLPQRWYPLRPGRFAVLLLSALFLFRILGAMTPDIDRARRVHYHERNTGWRPFAEQLYRAFPNPPAGSALGFLSPPFDDQTHEQWCLHFLVWLGLGDEVRVFRLPREASAFEKAAAAAPQARLFEWDGERLRERDVPPPSGR